jgi:hypothetical protein
MRRAIGRRQFLTHSGAALGGAALLGRRDGLVFQVIGDNDYYGFNDETTLPDRAEAERALGTIAALFSAPR